MFLNVAPKLKIPLGLKLLSWEAGAQDPPYQVIGKEPYYSEQDGQ